MNQRNIEIFNDTMDYIKSNSILSNSLANSIKNTILYRNISAAKKTIKSGKISVTSNKSFEAAIKLHNKYPGMKIGVLNFASATNPGGGVTHGSSAQEESLCKCSTLYPVLNTQYLFNNYYQVNRKAANPLHDDTIIYCPKINICKSDDGLYRRLNEKEFVEVDVISAAAPNLRERPTNSYNSDGNKSVKVTNKELHDIHVSRGRQILEAAIKNNVDVLVLGAFGCGAFQNDPNVVAQAYKELLSEYAKYFELIEFAVYCNRYDSENYDVFKLTLGR